MLYFYVPGVLHNADTLSCCTSYYLIKSKPRLVVAELKKKILGEAQISELHFKF